MKVLFTVIIISMIITACATPSEIWLKENPPRIYEITSLNYETITIRARKCEAFRQSATWGNNNTPSYNINCSNDGSDWWSIYNGMGYGLREISN